MRYESLLSEPVVQKYIHDLVGPEGINVAMSPPAAEVTDEELADDLEMELNVVRRTLMLLSENGLADYRRVRDEESGWLTYLWTFKYDRLPEIMVEDMKQLRELLAERRTYEQGNQFYICDVCVQRFVFDDAIEFGFECPNCAGSLESRSSDAIVEALDARIAEIEVQLSRLADDMQPDDMRTT